VNRCANSLRLQISWLTIEGSKADIEKQLKTSLEAFFDFYPEI